MSPSTPALHALPPLERDVLTVLATFPRALSRSELEEKCRLVGLRAGSRALSGDALKAVMATLLRANLIAASPYDPRAFAVPASLVGAVLEDARSRGRLIEVARALQPARYIGWSAPEEGIRRAVLLEDAAALAMALRPLAYTKTRRGEVSALVGALTVAAPRAWFAQLPADLRDEYLKDALDLAILELVTPGADVLTAAAASPQPEVRARAALHGALSGDAGRATACLPPDAVGPWVLGARAVIDVTLGEWAAALGAFDRACTTRQGTRRSRGLPSYLAVLDLLLAASPAATGAAAASLAMRVAGASTTLQPWPVANEALERLASFRLTGRAAPRVWSGEGGTWIDQLVCGLARRWMSDGVPEAAPAELMAVIAAEHGYGWIARQLRALHAEAPPEGTLAALRQRQAPWELALDALTGAMATGGTSASTWGAAAGEIAWVIDGYSAEFDEVLISARLVKKAGQVGAHLSIDRMETDASLPVLPEDRPLIDAMVAATRAYRGEGLPLRTLLLAVGHPRLRDGTGRPLAVQRGVPELHVKETPGGARIEMVPCAYGPSGVALVAERGRLVVFERTDAAARVAAVVGKHGVDVPRAGLPRAAAALSLVATSLPVRGFEALGAAVGARAEPADGRLRVQIVRAGSAYRVRLRVVPGGDEGPALRPGAEPAHVVIAGKDSPRAVARDLGAERSAVQRLVAECAALAGLGSDGEDLVVSDVEGCLELLLALEPHRAEDVIVEWPEGEPLRAPLERDARDLRVRVGGEAQWLEVDAELRVDELHVLGFAELVERASLARGRFVPLRDGQYVALTEKLRAQVAALARVAALSDRRGRASMAVLPALASWVDGADLELTAALRARLDALQHSLDARHDVPRALRAELRDYQRDGFAFLARRAASGVGACLADDMGLGKTVQALALLVSRARTGPALVVAPTSVCRNWESEARRFAPTLAFHSLAAASDRAACIEGLKKGDVLVVSYGLLASSFEALASLRFGTAVFDEAHALKNPETRRAVAARAIAADAIVALTGTPLENHLGELHSLFDVLAPGLLGTRERFERAFASPIARGDKRATSHLRSLVRPFLLRRTKSEVLDELPEKTEMTRVLTPAAAERAFYEALRRSAVERVSEANGSRGRIQILAEITKLRRAAVDPRLVGGDDAPAGAKLEALADLVDELRDEGHRALVFSQFLEVLDRAGELLSSRGARCVRLDGTMSADVRAASVDAFQSGQADVFLLSLRAGGVGMNLTAADYVIHLDPWWNPAVEDQATDRAHRIGQTRPVTVVRLVTEGTIEEKVLRLHAGKRALYAEALEQLDAAKKLDIAALVSLLSEETRENEQGAGADA